MTITTRGARGTSDTHLSNAIRKSDTENIAAPTHAQNEPNPGNACNATTLRHVMVKISAMYMTTGSSIMGPDTFRTPGYRIRKAVPAIMRQDAAVGPPPVGDSPRARR